MRRNLSRDPTGTRISRSSRPSWQCAPPTVLKPKAAGPLGDMHDGRLSGRRLQQTLLLVLCGREVIHRVRCHVDLNGIADAVELVIGDRNNVATEAQETADLKPDGGLAARQHDYALNFAKVGPVR